MLPIFTLYNNLRVIVNHTFLQCFKRYISISGTYIATDVGLCVAKSMLYPWLYSWDNVGISLLVSIAISVALYVIFMMYEPDGGGGEGF